MKEKECLMAHYNRKIAVFLTPALLISTVHVSPVAAMQSNVWGPWYSTKCRDKPIYPDMGGQNIPASRGNPLETKPVQECQWERKKNDCPKVTSKIKKPIKCFFRYEKSREWSVNPPSN